MATVEARRRQDRQASDGLQAAAREHGVEDMATPRSMAMGRAARMVGAVVLVLIVLAALTGWLGVSTTTTTAQAGGYTLTVLHPSIARSGDTGPFEVDIDLPQPATDPVTVVVGDDYLSMFEAIQPQPQPTSSTSTADGTALRLQFDPPDGTRLHLDLTGPLNGSARWWFRGSIAVLDATGHEAVHADLATFVLP